MFYRGEDSIVVVGEQAIPFMKECAVSETGGGEIEVMIKLKCKPEQVSVETNKKNLFDNIIRIAKGGKVK